MTSRQDILGRPPVMRPIQDDEIIRFEDDWRGEHLIKIEPVNRGSFVSQKYHPGQRTRESAKIERRGRVAVLHGQGVNKTAIAAQIGVSETCVVNDLIAMGFRK